MLSRRGLVLAVSVVVWIAFAARAVGSESEAINVDSGVAVPAQDESSDEPVPKLFDYSKDGLDIRSRDGNFTAHIDWRAQLRFTSRDFDDPVAPNPDDREGDFVINRARFKLGGHAYRPWLTYYFEYDFPRNALLDLRFSLKARDELQLRVGQWKVPYNRERVDSSGKQQFAERSIVTPWFTLDRQQGADLFGRFWKGRRADSWYHLGVYSATGRGGQGSVEQPMILGRWQWNFLGRDLPFRQCDLKYHERPAASLAVAGVSWLGPYSAFATAGGGGLPGLPVGQSDSYDVSQALIETALKYRGLSWQQEYHRKRVEVTETGEVTDLVGWYAQLGYFFHGVAGWFPEKLEIAARVARVDPDLDLPEDHIGEATLVFNYFFHGHRNKLTLDISRIYDRSGEVGKRIENRLRLQWDVSF
jgi:phosphate-selective porin